MKTIEELEAKVARLEAEEQKQRDHELKLVNIADALTAERDAARQALRSTEGLAKRLEEERDAARAEVKALSESLQVEMDVHAELVRCKALLDEAAEFEAQHSPKPILKVVLPKLLLAEARVAELEAKVARLEEERDGFGSEVADLTEIRRRTAAERDAARAEVARLETAGRSLGERYDALFAKSEERRRALEAVQMRPGHVAAESGEGTVCACETCALVRAALKETP